MLLHETVRKDDIHGNTTLQRLEQCGNYSKQCGNNVTTLCCAKTRRCQSSRVISPYKQQRRRRLRKRHVNVKK